jgi:hypothetical protein
MRAHQHGRGRRFTPAPRVMGPHSRNQGTPCCEACGHGGRGAVPVRGRRAVANDGWCRVGRSPAGAGRQKGCRVGWTPLVVAEMQQGRRSMPRDGVCFGCRKVAGQAGLRGNGARCLWACRVGKRRNGARACRWVKRAVLVAHAPRSVAGASGAHGRPTLIRLGGVLWRRAGGRGVGVRSLRAHGREGRASLRWRSSNAPQARAARAGRPAGRRAVAPTSK